MKKWIISLTISFALCSLCLVYFAVFMMQDGCLDAGGIWLGALKGCEGGNHYSPQFLTSPLTVAIFFGIVLGICSALVQFHTILFKHHSKT